MAEKGQRIATKGLVLQVVPSLQKEPCPSDELEFLRLGFTVTRRVGNAVIRNRTKRRLRALATEIMSECARPGFDYVLIARQSIINRSFVDLRKDLKYALHQTGTYRKKTSGSESQMSV